MFCWYLSTLLIVKLSCFKYYWNVVKLFYELIELEPLSLKNCSSTLFNTFMFLGLIFWRFYSSICWSYLAFSNWLFKNILFLNDISLSLIRGKWRLKVFFTTLLEFIPELTDSSSRDDMFNESIWNFVFMNICSFEFFLDFWESLLSLAIYWSTIIFNEFNILKINCIL